MSSTIRLQERDMELILVLLKAAKGHNDHDLRGFTLKDIDDAIQRMEEKQGV